MKIFGELKRRNVFRVGIAYLIGAWLFIQVADVVLGALSAPDTVIRAVMAILALGLIPTLIFSWVYEMTPDGVKKATEIETDQSITHETGKKLDIATMIMLVSVVALVVVERYLPESDSAVPQVRPAMTDDSEAGAVQVPDGNVESASTSIAVLPFANRSNQEDDLYFTDGIHDDLLTQLAKISGLTVISRTSVMEYRNSPKNLTEIAAELKVGTILEGGVQKVGDRVRINAQLIEAKTDRHLWAETFDRELTAENVFDLQSEISRKIVEAVAVQLTPEEERILAQVPTRNLAAYEAYIRARELYYGVNYSISQEIAAEPLLERAIELDPGYLEAQVLLASIYGQKYWRGIDTSEELLRKYRDKIELANRLDPDSPATLRARANYHYRVDRDFALSLELLERALKVAPGDVDLHGDIGLSLRRLGRWEESIDSLKRTLELDPVNNTYQALLLETLGMIRDWQAVVDFSDSLEDADPDRLDAQISRAAALFNLTGDLEPMERVFEHMNLELSNDFALWSTRVHILQRDYDGALEVVQGPVWEEAKGDPGINGLIYRWQLAQILRFKGEEEKARQYYREIIGRRGEPTPTSIQSRGTEFLLIALSKARLGQYEEALALANQVLEERPPESDAVQGNLAYYFRASIRGLSGDRDGAIADLSIVLNSVGTANFTAWDLYYDPEWDFMRDDPRFVELATPDNLIQ